MNIRLTLKRFLAAGLSMPCLSYAILCLVVSFSPHNIVNDKRVLDDARISGVRSNLDTVSTLRFSDPRVTNWSSMAEVVLARGEHRVIFQRNNRDVSITVGGEALSDSLVDKLVFNEPEDRDFPRIEAQLAKMGSERMKFVRASVKPSHGIFALNSSFALLPCLLLTFVFLANLLATFKTFNGEASIVRASASWFLVSLIFLITPYAYWEYALWAAFAFGCIVLGEALQESAKQRAIFGEISFNPFLGKNRVWAPILLIVILMIAASVRTYGFSFGYPDLYNEEEALGAEVVTTLSQTRRLPPEAFAEPAFFSYLNFMLSRAYESSYGEFPTALEVVTIGRSISFFCALLCVILIYSIGKELYDSRVALLSAALFAFSPLAVTWSRYAVGELLFSTISLIFVFLLLSTLRRKSFKLYVATASVCGIACATRFAGLALIPLAFIPLLITRLAVTEIVAPRRVGTFGEYLRSWDPMYEIYPILRRWPYIIGVIPLSFIAASPYIFRTTGSFWSSVAERFSGVAGPASVLSRNVHLWAYHLTENLWFALTPGAAFLCLVGIGFMFSRRNIADMLVLILTGFTYVGAVLFLDVREARPEKSFIACLPFLSISFAVALVFFYEAFRALPSKRWVVDDVESSGLIDASPSPWRNHAALAMIALVVAWPLAKSIQFAYSIPSDTRSQSEVWIEDNLPKGSTIMFESPYTSPHLPDTFDLVQTSKVPNSIVLSKLFTSGADYLVLSSLYYDRFIRPERKDAVMKYRYQRLFAKLKPIHEISDPSNKHGFHNPKISVFKLKP